MNNFLNRSFLWSLFILLFLVLAEATFQSAQNNETELHVIFYTHSNYGGEHTAEEYLAGVLGVGSPGRVFDTAVHTLKNYPEAVIVTDSMGYLKMWMDRFFNSSTQVFFEISNSSQFEVVNGGISSPDEACIHYDHLIETFTIGHKWLKDILGYHPQYAWSLEAAGHSKAYAWLLAKMGFNAIMLEKVHKNDREARKQRKEFNFLWQPIAQFDEKIYVEIADYPYQRDLQFWRWYHAARREWSDRDYEVWTNERKELFLTNAIQHHIGGNFNFSFDANPLLNDAQAWVNNLKTFSGLRPKFSSLSNYFKRVNEIYTKNGYAGTYPDKFLKIFKDDFFPLVTEKDEAWTGFYTTNSIFKGIVFSAARYFTALKNLYSKLILKDQAANWVEGINNIWNELWAVDEMLGILAQHDVISGTSAKRVNVEYLEMLSSKKFELDKVSIYIQNL